MVVGVELLSLSDVRECEMSREGEIVGVGLGVRWDLSSMYINGLF